MQPKHIIRINEIWEEFYNCQNKTTKREMTILKGINLTNMELVPETMARAITLLFFGKNFLGGEHERKTNSATKAKKGKK
jgi:hypothetical protein